MPLGFIGELQEYMIKVEAGFDERDMAVNILSKQLLEPVPIEPKKEEPKGWWNFWR